MDQPAQRCANHLIPTAQLVLIALAAIGLLVMFFLARSPTGSITGDDADGILGFILGGGGLLTWHGVRSGRVPLRLALAGAACFVALVVARYVVLA
jgi:hypothetical protein